MTSSKMLRFPMTMNGNVLNETDDQPKFLPAAVLGLTVNDTYEEPALVDTGYNESLQQVKSHAAEPLKKIEDIYAVSDYLINNQRYRDNLLFIAGINFGFRMGDLLSLKIGDLVNADWRTYREKVVIEEQKTKKIRTVYPNEAVCQAMGMYLEDLVSNGEKLDRNRYIFAAMDNKNKKTGKPISVRQANNIIPDVINKECGIDIQASTHTIRKTFAYHVIMGAEDRTRAIEFLQKLLNHSSASITLRYAGITDDEIRDAYQSLNLGLSNQIARSAGFAMTRNVG